MKFLVITSFKDTSLMVPPSVVRKAMEETLDIMNQAMKSGGILEMYVIPGQNRAVSIQEEASAEAMAEHMNSVPVASLMNFEIYPLSEWEPWVKSFMDYLKMAEKMGS